MLRGPGEQHACSLERCLCKDKRGAMPVWLSVARPPCGSRALSDGHSCTQHYGISGDAEQCAVLHIPQAHGTVRLVPEVPRCLTHPQHAMPHSCRLLPCFPAHLA